MVRKKKNLSLSLKLLKNDYSKVRYAKFGIKEPAKEKHLKKKRNWRKIFGRAALAATGAAAIGATAYLATNKNARQSVSSRVDRMRGVSPEKTAAKQAAKTAQREAIIQQNKQYDESIQQIKQANPGMSDFQAKGLLAHQQAKYYQEHPEQVPKIPQNKGKGFKLTGDNGIFETTRHKQQRAYEESAKAEAERVKVEEAANRAQETLNKEREAKALQTLKKFREKTQKQAREKSQQQQEKYYLDNFRNYFEKCGSNKKILETGLNYYTKGEGRLDPKKDEHIQFINKAYSECQPKYKELEEAEAKAEQERKEATDKEKLEKPEGNKNNSFKKAVNAVKLIEQTKKQTESKKAVEAAKAEENTKALAEQGREKLNKGLKNRLLKREQHKKVFEDILEQARKEKLRKENEREAEIKATETLKNFRTKAKAKAEQDAKKAREDAEEEALAKARAERQQREAEIKATETLKNFRTKAKAKAKAVEARKTATTREKSLEQLQQADFEKLEQENRNKRVTEARKAEEASKKEAQEVANRAQKHLDEEWDDIKTIIELGPDLNDAAGARAAKQRFDFYSDPESIYYKDTHKIKRMNLLRVFIVGYNRLIDDAKQKAIQTRKEQEYFTKQYLDIIDDCNKKNILKEGLNYYTTGQGKNNKFATQFIEAIQKGIDKCDRLDASKKAKMTDQEKKEHNIQRRMNDTFVKDCEKQAHGIIHNLLYTSDGTRKPITRKDFMNLIMKYHPDKNYDGVTGKTRKEGHDCAEIIMKELGNFNDIEQLYTKYKTSGFGKSKKLKDLKTICKSKSIRLTYIRNGKRYYKTEKQLKRQLKNVKK